MNKFNRAKADLLARSVVLAWYKRQNILEEEPQIENNVPGDFYENIKSKSEWQHALDLATSDMHKRLKEMGRYFSSTCVLSHFQERAISTGVMFVSTGSIGDYYMYVNEHSNLCVAPATPEMTERLNSGEFHSKYAFEDCLSSYAKIGYFGQSSEDDFFLWVKNSK